MPADGAWGVRRRAGGENVFSSRVEEALLRHPATADAPVVARPQPDWGETAVAFVVPKSDADGPLGLDEVRVFLAAWPAKVKMRRELIVSDSLPRNASGVLAQHVLRDGV